MNPRSSSLLCVALVLAWSVLDLRDAHAELIVSNLNQTSNGDVSISTNSHILAMPFALDTSFTPSTLDSAVLDVYQGQQSATATLQLWSNNGSLPGSPVVSFNSQLITSTFESQTDYTFTPASPYTLLADTTYWLVLGWDGGAALLWSTTASTATDPLSNRSASLDAGQDDQKEGRVAVVDVTDPLQFAVYGTPVVASAPEPSAMAMMTLALAMCGGWVWCRRVFTPSRRT
jgi:hypothetical protein